MSAIASRMAEPVRCHMVAAVIGGRIRGWPVSVRVRSDTQRVCVAHIGRNREQPLPVAMRSVVYFTYAW
jgi:hypothetical protein